MRFSVEVERPIEGLPSDRWKALYHLRASLWKKTCCSGKMIPVPCDPESMNKKKLMKNSEERQKKVLMHICCAPCSIYPLKKMREEGAYVYGYFFNPNIHPYREFRKRLATLEEFAGTALLPLEVDRDYDLEAFLRGALDSGEDRCLFCYRMRLDKTFKKGIEDRADAVTTTLLYSKYQKHEAIRSTGEELSEKYGIPFLYRDFREGWSEGVKESKTLDMYRQPYCGCIFSEKERYWRVG